MTKEPVTFKPGDRVISSESEDLHEDFRGVKGTIREERSGPWPDHWWVILDDAALMREDTTMCFRGCYLILLESETPGDPPCPLCGTPGYFFGCIGGHNCVSTSCAYHE